MGSTSLPDLSAFDERNQGMKAGKSTSTQGSECIEQNGIRNQTNELLKSRQILKFHVPSMHGTRELKSSDSIAS